MKLLHPDVKNCLVNLSNSFLKRYGVPTFHPTMGDVDSILACHDHVVVLLFDGMGKALLDKHLSPGHPFKKAVFKTITSTFPPTTVAATTSLLNGRFPIETGWLGWNQYFKEFKRNVDVFNNDDSVTKIKVAPGNALKQKAPYEDILSMIAKAHPDLYVTSLWPDIIQNGTVVDLQHFFKETDEICSDPRPKFIYGYWHQPDGLIHLNGVSSSIVAETIGEIAQGVLDLAQKHPQTLFLVLADHGLVDVEFLAMEEHPDFYATTKRMFSNEPRAPFFFVKPHQEAQFEQLFQHYYGNDFVLMSRKEVLSQQWFGEGIPHPVCKEFIGDYMAVATSNKAFDYLIDGKIAHAKFKAHHAGMTEEEMLIDLMILNR